jgi:hypothetical protein
METLPLKRLPKHAHPIYHGCGHIALWTLLVLPTATPAATRPAHHRFHSLVLHRMPFVGKMPDQTFIAFQASGEGNCSVRKSWENEATRELSDRLIIFPHWILFCRISFLAYSVMFNYIGTLISM